MEFHEKLQELRKQRGLTQEELAETLYVSRAAISKWESGRGYPNIESLKAIAKFFSVSIDSLLSGEELLSLAEEDTAQKTSQVENLVFGLLDCSAAMLLFLPLFGLRTDGAVHSVSLLALSKPANWLIAVYAAVVIGMIGMGVGMLALQNYKNRIWLQNKGRLSLLFNSVGVFVFMVSLQPYAAALLFVFLVMKVLLLLKWR